MIRKEVLDDSINMIARNAIRLKQLSEDILDEKSITEIRYDLRGISRLNIDIMMTKYL